MTGSWRRFNDFAGRRNPGFPTENFGNDNMKKYVTVAESPPL
jgi:hypothetical protein